MGIETNNITEMPFSKEGFEELKCEVKVLIELVSEMGALLTHEQKSVINERQKSRHPSQEEFDTFLKARGKEPVNSVERATRIRRLLVT